MMRTAGIDLASKSPKTAVCVIDWDSGRRASIKCWKRSGWTDEKLIQLMGDGAINRIAIDAPFGWPIGYVNAISEFRDDGTWPEGGSDEDFGRFRMTELNVKETTGVTPLSSSLGNFAWVTRRCARLLAREVRGESAEAARMGEGCFLEVYPAAALKRWQISPADLSHNPGSYKGNKPESVERRQKLAESLADELGPVLDIRDDFVDRCAGAGGDDLVDALVAALVARAMAKGRCGPIPSNAMTKASARCEGWIRLPGDYSVLESVR